MFSGTSKKRPRVGSSGRLFSYADIAEPKSEEPLPSPAISLRHLTATAVPAVFNDPTTADVLLRLQICGSPDFSLADPTIPSSDPAASLPSLELHLHSSTIRRSGYFAARLSDRWLRPDPSTIVESSSSSGPLRLALMIPNPGNCRRPFDVYVAVLQLLYTFDFTGAILSVTDALEMLPVGLELLFDECVRACVRFIEAVPWTEEEEEGVLSLIPFLREEESRDLLARVCPAGTTAGDGKNISEDMLYGLVLKVMHNNPGWASVKAFMAKLLRDYLPRDSVKRVLDRAFLESLRTVKELLGEYASPDFRVAGDNDETEAIQRLKIYTAKVNVRNLIWLVDRMLELKVADTAAKEWSEQSALTADLQKTFRDDTWRNIAPGLPTLVLRCTSRLTNAIAAGSILAPRQVRMELVKQWLPVLNVCREISCGTPSEVYQDLEETFLRIISTLPISDAQNLLQECLCFSTRNIDNCPHLALAFTTWFRRANRQHLNNDPTTS